MDLLEILSKLFPQQFRGAQQRPEDMEGLLQFLQQKQPDSIYSDSVGYQPFTHMSIRTPGLTNGWANEAALNEQYDKDPAREARVMSRILQNQRMRKPPTL